MNRTQYLVLLVGSSLVVLFLLLQVIFARQSQYAQARIVAAQQVVAEGRSCDSRLRQLAARIYQVSVQSQDAGLKELLTRQQITVSAPAATAASAAAPIGSPGSTTR